MSWLRKFITKAKSQNTARDEIIKDFIYAIDSGTLTEDVIAEIKAKRKELNIDDKSWAKMQNHFYILALNNAMQDRRLSPEEDKMLTLVLNHFSITEKVKNSSKKDLIRSKLLYDIESGELPIIDAPGISMQKNELVHWIEPASMLEEKTNRRYVGGSQGVSIRVAKGITFRTGGYRGHVVTNQEIIPVSIGELIITNKRIIFRGDRKNFTTTWAKVIDLDFYSDGIKVGKEGRQKPSIFKFNDASNTEVIGTICSILLNSIE